jgi:hypothetical protein
MPPSGIQCEDLLEANMFTAGVEDRVWQLVSQNQGIMGHVVTGL